MPLAMSTHLGEARAAGALERGVYAALADPSRRTADPASLDAFTATVIEQLE